MSNGKQNKSSEKSRAKSNVGLGVSLGVAALAAAATAYYFYGTKKGEERREDVKNWTIAMKKEVVEKLKNIKDINEETYHRIIDEVSEKYKTVKEIDVADLLAVAATLKNYWDNISKKINDESKKVAKNISTRPGRSHRSGNRSETKKKAT